MLEYEQKEWVYAMALNGMDDLSDVSHDLAPPIEEWTLRYESTLETI